jgi:peptidoglycan/xylan/chitin deacetylase (PgdA/CDA1 family)
MNRRNFIETAGLLSLGLGMEGFIEKRKTHILTLSFDDGFKKSFYKIAEIYEMYGLKACFNVIAMGHEKGFVQDAYILPGTVGNFDDWNTLKSRGHEIMPHSWDHKNLTQLPVNEAKENLDKCFDYFEKNLVGYKAEKAVYNFAYNASNEALIEHALGRVRAIRTGGWMVLKDTKYNAIPRKKDKRLQLGCWGCGPDVCDDYVEAEVNAFLKGAGGWLMLNLHGLDNEGWGPISTNYLDRLLKRVVKISNLNVLPAGQVLSK